ncbi:MAG TPA: hydrolase 2, exosortase A system-associated [Noviherbaspirillum sp.]|nr:hydrolase 2, exosortase A system-associated [Noviherbaspirillum sp.]
MNILQETARPFFLDASPGRRFVLLHAPAQQPACRGAIIYLPPFGDEMNMSRRMAAQQARAFAAVGFAVLQIDLFGCGDSSGDLRDARWEIWKRDLMHAIIWVRDHASSRIILWGLRLGATLAMDFARNSPYPIECCIAWQPIISGEQYVTQLLRMRQAGDMTAQDALQGGTIQALRAALRNGKMVEVGGYELSSTLVADFDHVELGRLDELPCPVHWLEMVRSENASIPLARMNTVNAWLDKGIDVRLQAVAGPSFWGTREVSECQTLISTSTALLEEAIA